MNIKRIGLIGGSYSPNSGNNTTGDSLWEISSSDRLQHKRNNAEVCIGTEIRVTRTYDVHTDRIVIDVDRGIQIERDNIHVIEISPHVSMGTGSPLNKIVYIGSNVFIGKNVTIQDNFDTRRYFDSNNDLISACIPIDSSLKNSSQLAVNIEPQSNGNIKIGDTLFMPATPSGDPMHYAYETAGAEYNSTTDFIVKDAPWADMVDTIDDKAKWGFDIVDASQVKQMTISGTTYNYVQTTRQSPEDTTELRYYLVGQASDGTWVEDETKVLHLPGHWYLNGLGDITGREINNIYNAPRINVGSASLFSYSKIRTAISGTAWGGEGTPFSLYYICASSSIVALNLSICNKPYLFTTRLEGNTNDSFKYFINVMKHDNSKTLMQYSPSLKTLLLSNLKTNLECSTSKYISKISILHIINNAAPTTAITITLHTDRYAQLSDDADIRAALDAKNAALEGTGGSISLVSA